MIGTSSETKAPSKTIAVAMAALMMVVPGAAVGPSVVTFLGSLADSPVMFGPLICVANFCAYGGHPWVGPQQSRTSDLQL